MSLEPFFFFLGMKACEIHFLAKKVKTQTNIKGSGNQVRSLIQGECKSYVTATERTEREF